MQNISLDQIAYLAVRHSNHYTGKFSVFVWGCKLILFMHRWFCPVHLIRWKSLHFEKKVDCGNNIPLRFLDWLFQLWCWFHRNSTTNSASLWVNAAFISYRTLVNLWNADHLQIESCQILFICLDTLFWHDSRRWLLFNFLLFLSDVEVFVWMLCQNETSVPLHSKSTSS